MVILSKQVLRLEGGEGALYESTECCVQDFFQKTRRI